MHLFKAKCLKNDLNPYFAHIKLFHVTGMAKGVDLNQTAPVLKILKVGYIISL